MEDGRRKMEDGRNKEERPEKISKLGFRKCMNAAERLLKPKTNPTFFAVGRIATTWKMFISEKIERRF